MSAAQLDAGAAREGGSRRLTARQGQQLERAGARARAALARRDELILEALAAGVGQREVARAVGLSHTAVQNLARRSA